MKSFNKFCEYCGEYISLYSQKDDFVEYFCEFCGTKTQVPQIPFDFNIEWDNIISSFRLGRTKRTNKKGGRIK